MSNAFTLDTSGAVRLVPAKSDPDGPIIRWSDLDPFTQGYGTAAAEELYERLVCEGWTPEAASAAVAFRNWSPSALGRIVRDCGAVSSMWPTWASRDMAGLDFWSERQDTRLGCDGQWGRQGFPPLTVSLDDAGRVTLQERS